MLISKCVVKPLLQNSEHNFAWINEQGFSEVFVMDQFAATENLSVTKDNSSKLGHILMGMTGSLVVIITAGCVPFISPALRRVCLPYVPATPLQVENVFKALSGRKGKLVDIGSGDGRIVITAAKLGFQAHGVELNPWLVLYSKLQAFRSGAGKETAFFRRNLWSFNLFPYQNIVIFGVKEMMPELEVKFSRELVQGAVVAACRFPLPSRTPIRICGSGIDTVWLYQY